MAIDFATSITTDYVDLNNNICYKPFVAYKNPEHRRAASRRHYAAHKQTYLERNTKYRLSIRKFVQALKEQTPCTDCGIQHPYYVMDFDHLDESLKLNDINYLASTGRIGALKKEIVKCEIVCANCHRIRTHNRASKLP